MAKITAGYMGPFSGKLGTGVGYTWNGIWCVRSYRKDAKNPRTPAQVEHRDMFKQEVQLAAKMRWVVNETLTDLARKNGMTAYNLFVKENQHAFGYADGQLAVDYQSLRLSIGDAQGVAAERMTLDEDNVLTVNFARGTGRAFDKVFLYVYVPDLGKGFLTTAVYRRERRISLSLPDNYAGHQMHAWLMVESELGGWSESTYVGSPEVEYSSETVQNQDIENMVLNGGEPTARPFGPTTQQEPAASVIRRKKDLGSNDFG